MRLYLFRLLSSDVQLHYVLTSGTYLAQRGGEVGVNLYHCADEGRGFFVEVSYDASHLQAVVLRSFNDSEPLEDYVYNPYQKSSN